MNDHSRGERRRGHTAKQEFLASWKRDQESEAARPDDLGVDPYPGLRSFQPNEADLFFGRDSQIKELRERLASHNIIVVLGGSGSGKSSLVRAGLVPKLNSTEPIPDRVGAWYVVEFRPKLDPVNELFEAIFKLIVSPVLETPVGKPDLANERARRIGALNAAFNLGCELDAPNDHVELQCRMRLREILFEGNVVAVGALFDFVEERLRVFDAALAGGATSGAPNLLLLIDQFEEVFKPKVNAAGRDMIMSLITSIYAHKPFNSFLIITMRSEELHRCSEFLGVTEVVNSSLYLVDLIGGRDIEQAMVEPARRVLKSWDLDAGDPETGPYTRAALSELHQVFDEGREVLPHKADQLPLMQHLLPLVWDNAIERWQKQVDDATFQIDLEDIQALPGWNSPQGHLAGTLNERANAVLQRAVKAGANAAKSLDEEAVGQLLRVAFCCLAQLDDRGNVVRDFATLDDMLQASGVYERHSQQPEECRKALRAALDVFQRATLVNAGKNYDVNHEAFIRGWTKYKDWLEVAKRRMDRLVFVDDAIRQAFKEQGDAPTPLWKKIWERISTERYARADQIAGSKETRDDLQDVLGPNSAFSEHWARQALERGSTNPRARPVAQRIGAIRQTVNDAIQYPIVKKKQFWSSLAAGLAVLVVGGVLIGAWARQKLITREEQQARAQSQDLNEQFRFFRLQSEATYTPVLGARSPGNDRELYAALKLALGRAEQQRAKSSVDEGSAVFRASLRQLDRGARSVLSETSVLRVATNPELADLRRAPANCAVADPEQLSQDLIGDEPGRLGVRLRSHPGPPPGAVMTTAMFPIWRPSVDETAPVDQSNLVGLAGQQLPSGALVCLSNDANWLLTWQPGTSPAIQRITWIRTGAKADRDGKWHAALGPSRFPGTLQSHEDLAVLSDEYSRLFEAVRKRERAFEFFRSDNNVGFLIAMAGDRRALFWTTTGLLDPDPVEDAPPYELSPCVFKPSSRLDERGETAAFMLCEMGRIDFDNLNHRLLADYMIDGGPQSPCKPEGALCRTELRIEYEPQDAERDTRRIVLSHLSSTIKEAAIWDGSLWLRDANGQVWKYLVGLDPIARLLEERWKGIDYDDVAKVTYSEACTAAKCDKIGVVPGWPTKRQEPVK